jgi:hypothetical protein
MRLSGSRMASADVFHDFTFTDRGVESGITFRHRIAVAVGHAPGRPGVTTDAEFAARHR